MVWFQCEDCGDNLKKPKLASHFRACSANKAIRQIMNFAAAAAALRASEKYGPKGLAKTSNGTPGKPNSSAKPKPEVDINVGLSERPPWFCSLCNTSATSKQTLLLHADGKKHRAKARAYHASKQPPKDPEGPTPNTESKSENIQNTDLPPSEGVKKESPSHASESKKRKLEASENNGELSNGEVIHDSNAESEKTKKAKGNKEDVEKKIKWKKIITAVLKSNPDGNLKMRKLRTQVLKTIRESGSTIDENILVDTLEHKISSSSKFAVNGKYVQLVSKS
ncbi:hypothetical protein M8C21_002684 [Ambrosia artemisiifolia]|uniref:U1-type domain-containing protein n=1 Tax=Ambrosia artemisiifolia TaxID=4212 RepID=A0AAD5G2H4_AMBAR|nr:hypothetical protein M8C21_002684 [Ambrosia artemisiifolia]